MRVTVAINANSVFLLVHGRDHQEPAMTLYRMWYPLVQWSPGLVLLNEEEWL